MKILFTSDLHGDTESYNKFIFTLENNDYDIGIIAGDLMEDRVSKIELLKRFNLTSDDIVQELPLKKDFIEKFMERAIKNINNSQEKEINTLKIKEVALKLILGSTNKPILIIQGNHDETEWKSWKNIYNIHFKRIKIGKYNFIGYKYTEYDKWESDRKSDLEILKYLIDQNTIFVTHGPAYGILDKHYDGKCSIGSRSLLSVIREKNPKFHLFGHVHPCFGYQENSVNGAYPISKKFISIDTETNEIKERE